MKARFGDARPRRIGSLCDLLFSAGREVGKGVRRKSAIDAGDLLDAERDQLLGTDLLEPG